MAERSKVTRTHTPVKEGSLSDTLSHDSLAHEHAAVLERALTLHVSRSERYGQMWQSYGWRGAVVHARSAVERAWRLLIPGDPIKSERDKAVDDLLDTINYCAFAIRNIEADNEEGSWEWKERP